MIKTQFKNVYVKPFLNVYFFYPDMYQLWGNVQASTSSTSGETSSWVLQQHEGMQKKYLKEEKPQIHSICETILLFLLQKRVHYAFFYILSAIDNK